MIHIEIFCLTLHPVFMPSSSLDWGRQTVLGHDGMMVELGHDSTLQAQDCCDKLDSEPQIEWRLNRKRFFFLRVKLQNLLLAIFGFKCLLFCRLMMVKLDDL